MAGDQRGGSSVITVFGDQIRRDLVDPGDQFDFPPLAQAHGLCHCPACDQLDISLKNNDSYNQTDSDSHFFERRNTS
ncbi:hypothetical protein GCM10009614_09310 [Glutamicibacter uratoxydans]